MKKISLIAFLVWSNWLLVGAELVAPAGGETNQPAPPAETNQLTMLVGTNEVAGAGGTNQMVITADGGCEYSPGVAICRNNVHVMDPRMEMLCELLTVHLSTNENKIQMIVAETNVVLIQKENLAIGDKAIYNATNDVLILTGNVLVDTPDKKGLFTEIIYNRKNQKWSFGGPVTVSGSTSEGTNFLQSDIFRRSPTGTNPPATPPPESKP